MIKMVSPMEKRVEQAEGDWKYWIGGGEKEYWFKSGDQGSLIEKVMV